MIQTVMLVALGFFAASLLALLLAPSLWRRAERLTMRRLEQTLPMSISDIEADRDQLRAGYAIAIRRLEAALTQEKAKSARQLVEISRLQMQAMTLRDQIGEARSAVEARQNAVTVLQQTIDKRIPTLDQALTRANNLLHVRDRELASLIGRLQRREESLAAADRTAEMQQGEIIRLRQSMEISGAQNSARFKKRPSQWTLKDYRAEYDRLNVELSKLRERLSVAYERERHQLSHLRSEVQLLAENIISASALDRHITAVDRRGDRTLGAALELGNSAGGEPKAALEDRASSKPVTELSERSVDMLLQSRRATPAARPAPVSPQRRNATQHQGRPHAQHESMLSGLSPLRNAAKSLGVTIAETAASVAKGASSGAASIAGTVASGLKRDAEAAQQPANPARQEPVRPVRKVQIHRPNTEAEVVAVPDPEAADQDHQPARAWPASRADISPGEALSRLQRILERTPAREEAEAPEEAEPPSDVTEPDIRDGTLDEAAPESALNGPAHPQDIAPSPEPAQPEDAVTPDDTPEPEDMAPSGDAPEDAAQPTLPDMADSEDAPEQDAQPAPPEPAYDAYEQLRRRANQTGAPEDALSGDHGEEHQARSSSLLSRLNER